MAPTSSFSLLTLQIAQQLEKEDEIHQAASHLIAQIFMLLRHVSNAKERIGDETVQDVTANVLSLVEEVLRFIQDYVEKAGSSG